MQNIEEKCLTVLLHLRNRIMTSPSHVEVEACKDCVRAILPQHRNGLPRRGLLADLEGEIAYLEARLESAEK